MDERKFFYHCDEGHEIASRTEIHECPAVVKGIPCPGRLTRFGRGSRTLIGKPLPSPSS
jgi:hypothetical protein